MEGNNIYLCLNCGWWGTENLLNILPQSISADKVRINAPIKLCPNCKSDDLLPSTDGYFDTLNFKKINFNNT